MRTLSVVLLSAIFALAACKGCDTEPSNPDTDAGADASNSDACVPEGDAEFCFRIDAECGFVTEPDNCGEVRTVPCGTCPGSDVCFEDYTCGCAAETDEEFCARLMKDCGSVTAEDNCEAERTVDCGTCATGEECGGGGTDNVCGCPCNIDGECVPDGAVNPDNGCQVCDPAQSTDSWSAQPADTTCDDGLSCTASSVCDDAGTCVPGDPDSGSCVVDDACYADGDVNPANPCEVCDPDAASDGWTANDGATCEDNDGLSCTGVCDAGSCGSTPRSGTCLIDGACYDDLDENTGETCEQCRSDLDQTAWSQAVVGLACDDGLTCTPNSACGEFGDCQPGPPDQGTCAIDGACWTDGAENPNNPCEECDAANPLIWSGVTQGTNCDDGLVCTGNDACDGNGTCVGDTAGGFCAVDNACWQDGAINPSNPCEVCDANSATDAWSPVAQGTSCDAGLACASSAGMCDGGGTCEPDTIDANFCVVDQTCYADGTANPDDDCGFCDVSIDQRAWSNNDGAVCDDGDGLACTGVCFAGTCQSRARTGACAIDDTCYTDGDVNPLNECEQCDDALPNSWSGVAQGTSCDDGLVCTGNDVCDGLGRCVGDITATCAIDGACYPDGTINPNNPCQACDADRDPFAWTPRPQGSTCDDGLDCTTNEVCNGRNKCEGTLAADYCLIRDECYGEGARRPDVPDCQYCDSTIDPLGWTNETMGTTCDDGLSCTTGSTCNNGGRCREGQPVSGACMIDQACWNDGDVNPSNPCQVCDADLDGEVWSPNTPGTVCADGLSCTRNDVCNDTGSCVGTLDADTCAIDGACWPDGAANPANDCQFCDADVDPLAWAFLGQGTSCDDRLDCTSGDTCNDVGECVGTQDANTCIVDDACFADGEANPSNPCEACDATRDPTRFFDNDGAACDDMDALDCTGVCADGACVPDAVQGGSCAIDNACWSDGAVNPNNECEVCNASFSPTEWVMAADDTACGANDQNVCCAGTCQATCP